MYLRYVYYISKFYGLTPFQYDVPGHKLKKSVTASTLCLFICVIFNSAVICAILHLILTNWVSNRPKLVFVIIHSLAVFAIAFKNLPMHLIYIYNRNDLIKILNEACDILNKLYETCPDMKFVSTQYLKTKRTIIIFKILQVLTIFYLFLFDVVANYRKLSIIRSIMYFQLLTLPMIMTTVYFCGTTLASARFFEVLNEKLQKFTEISCEPNVGNEIDCAIVLHDRITNLMRKVNKMFDLQIVIFMIAAFVFSLSVVRDFSSSFCYKQRFSQISYRFSNLMQL